MTSVRRWLVRGAAAVGGVVGLALAGVAGGLLWLSSDGGERFVRDRVVDAVNGTLEQGQVHLGEVDWAGDTLVLHDVRIDGATRDRVIHIERLRAELALAALLDRRIHVEQLAVRRPSVHLPRRDDGALDLPTTASSTPSEGPTTFLPAGLTVRVDQWLVHQGQVALPDDSVHLSGWGAVGDASVRAEQIDIALVSSWAQQTPAVGPAALAGTLTVRGGTTVGLSAALDAQIDGAVARASGRVDELTAGAGPWLRGTTVQAAATPGAVQHLASLSDPTGEPVELPSLRPLHARVDAGGRLDELTLEGAVAWAERAAFASAGPPLATVAGQASLDGAAGHAEASLEVPSLQRLQPLAPASLAGVARGKATARWDGADAKLTGSLRADELSLPQLQVPRASVDLALDTAAEATAPAGHARLVVPRAVVSTPAGSVPLTLNARLRSDGETARAQLRGRGTVPAADGTIPAALGLDASAELATGATTIATVRARLGKALTLTNPEPWTLTVADGGAADLHASLAATTGERTAGTARVQASRLTAQAQHGQIHLDTVELGAVARGIAPLVQLPVQGGTADGHVGLHRGDGRPPSLTTDLMVRGLVAHDDLEPLDVVLSAHAADDRVAARAEVRAPNGQDLVQAELDAPLVPLQLLLACEQGGTLGIAVPEQPWRRLAGRSDRIPTSVALDDEGQLRPTRLSAVVTASGDLCDPDIDATATATGQLRGESVQARLDLTEAQADHTLSADVAVRVAGRRRALAEATVHHAPLRQLVAAETLDEPGLIERWDLVAKALGTPLHLATPSVEGRVYGRARAQGRGTTLARTTAQLGLAEVAVDGTSLGGRAEWTTEGDALLADLRAQIPGGDPLHLRGELDLAALQQSDTPVPFEVRADEAELPVASLVPFTGGQLTDGAGALTIDGSLGGTLQAPEGELALTADDAAFTVTSTGVNYQDVQLDARVDGRDLVIDTLTLDSRPRYGRYALGAAGTDLRVGGRVRLGEEGLDTQLTAELDDLWVLANRTGLLETAGTLQIDGVFPQVDITGDVSVVDGRFDLEKHLFLAAADAELDPRVQFVDDHPERLAGLDDEGDAAVSRAVDVQMEVDLGRTVQLSATVPLASQAGALGAAADADVDATVGGDVDLSIDEGEIDADGRLSTQGRVSLLTARFDIEQGLIRFDRARALASPNLDFTLTREGGDYGNVTARVRGTPGQLELTDLTSDNYPDQADVMALLLFGRPLSELGQGEGQAGSQLVQQALASVAGRQVEQALGVSVVDSVSYDADDGLALGWSLGTDAFLSVAVDPTAEEEENTTVVRLRWLVTDQAEAEVAAGDAGATETWLGIEERF